MLLESDIDPTTRKLIDVALRNRVMPLCWHIERRADQTVATGYVTVSLLHEADQIRQSWAEVLDLQPTSNGYTGTYEDLEIVLPDAIDPDEHCRVCGLPFDPRDPRPDGRKRYESGDTCRACVAADAGAS